MKMTTIAELVLNRLKGEKFKSGSPEEEFLFASFCEVNKHMSYSQRLQDLWVLYELGTSPGFFIDFGAGNGRDSSNSYILHKAYGWKGVLVEPNTDYDDNLKHHVSEGVQYVTGVAISNEYKTDADFVVSSDPSISTLHYTVDSDGHGGLRRQLPSERRKIETWQLSDLIRWYLPGGTTEVDYLSIDTEGSEYDILWQYFQDGPQVMFSAITVEHNYNQQARQRLFDLLTGWGYIRRFPQYSGHDDFYILKDKLRDSR
jgi:FkbM family methyltransferase